MFNLFRLFQPATQVSENPPCKFNTPSSLETWNPKEVSSVQHRESLLMHVSQGVIIPKSMSQSDFYIFQNRGIFLFFLSAAACSRGLVVSVWWCNAVTVLLQSSRKASATVFRAHTGLKQRHLHSPAAVWAPQPLRTNWEETSWSQGRGAEMSCISYEI